MRARNHRGRPRKITFAVVEQVGELMALGVPEEYACALAGVNPQTFGPAISRNQEFKAAMKVKHAAFMERALRAITEGGEVIEGKDADGQATQRVRPWTGMAWILERRYRPHFNKTDNHAFTNPEGNGCLLTEADMLELERITKAKVLGK